MTGSTVTCGRMETFCGRTGNRHVRASGPNGRIRLSGSRVFQIRSLLSSRGRAANIRQRGRLNNRWILENRIAPFLPLSLNKAQGAETPRRKCQSMIASALYLTRRRAKTLQHGSREGTGRKKPNRQGILQIRFKGPLIKNKEGCESFKIDFAIML